MKNTAYIEIVRWVYKHKSIIMPVITLLLAIFFEQLESFLKDVDTLNMSL